MRVLLLVSGFNGLTQRVWCWLREEGHVVDVHYAADSSGCVETAEEFQPDVILCPHLSQRLPEAVWRRWRTIALRPAPAGDRAPAPLERAIANSEPEWGVTAIEVTAEPDYGPVWATRTFTMPAEPPRKSTLYQGPVADAALACAREVLAKVRDPGFRPVPCERYPGRLAALRSRRTPRPEDRPLDWDDSTAGILRRIRAADPAPGVPATLSGVPVRCFDAHPLNQRDLPGWPGQIIGRSDGSLLVRTGDTAIWIGQLQVDGGGRAGIKLPAGTVLADAVRHLATEAPRYVRGRVLYRRFGPVGRVYFDFYNGEMSTVECRVLRDALRHATRQDTSLILLQSGPDAFSHGIHLRMIEAADNPTVEAWRNINAIEDVCEAIVTCPQPVVAALTGGAGAGGVMMALGADRVIARAGTVLNPYYASLGVPPSELRTATHAARAGDAAAERLLTACLPVSVTQARAAGLVDAIGPRDPERFAEWAIGFAHGLIGGVDAAGLDLLRERWSARGTTMTGRGAAGCGGRDPLGGTSAADAPVPAVWQNRSTRRSRRLRRLSSSAFQRIQRGEASGGAPRDLGSDQPRPVRESTLRLARHRVARATHPHP